MPELPPLPKEMITPKELPKAWQHADATRMIEQQKNRGIAPTTIVSDWNNSFFKPDDIANTKLLTNVCERHDIPVVISTGNGGDIIMNELETYQLRKPQVIIGLVGTEILVLHTTPDGTQTYEKDEAFDALLQSKNFDRHALASHAEEKIREWRRDEKSPNHSFQFDFQIPDAEKAFLTGDKKADTQPYKLSFYAFAKDGDRDVLAKAIQQEFPDTGIALCEEINYNKVHADEIAGGTLSKKFCIDLLPVTPKAFAIDYVEELLGVVRGLHVGDSGNDIPLVSGTVIGDGVIVGGAKPELPTQVLKNKKPIGITGFSRILEGSGQPTKKKIYDATTHTTEAAGSIIDAIVARLNVTKRFEPNPRFRGEIDSIIAELGR